MECRFTTWERIMLSTIVGRTSGDIAQIRSTSKLLDILELSGDEGREIGLREESGIGIVWSDTSRDWLIKIEDPKHVKILQDSFSAYNQWNAHDRVRVLELATKLGL